MHPSKYIVSSIFLSYRVILILYKCVGSGGWENKIMIVIAILSMAFSFPN